MSSNYHTAIVGGGFAGLTAAYELAKAGKRVIVLERDNELGGLAGGFKVGNEVLEKFYHHWFNNDVEIFKLIEELGENDNILLRPTRTGMYFSNQFFRLSTPMDLLRFKALPFIDRIRLGVAVLRAKSIKDWRQLEGLSAKEWLIDLCGQKAYDVVWDPLLVGKFGDVAEDVSAVWFWKKLVLRGGSRSSSGDEVLAYYKGGFAELANRLGEAIIKLGGEIRLNSGATAVTSDEGHATGVQVGSEFISADNVLLSTALPISAGLLEGVADDDYLQKLRRIRYLANVCMVLSLDRSLSDTYWLNVNDPGFPYVGVIEHTNFEPPSSYGGRHIVYLSKYLPPHHPMYTMSDAELVEFSIPHLQKMFPEFDRSWIQDLHVWRADYAQPIAEKHYSKLIPGRCTPISNVFVTSMAQVYPEDRGTNYAVREGREVCAQILKTGRN
ncbi:MULTISPECIES: NAD(P)/FAD-dependent oxidoreductase [Stenotrophomonas]|uniref:NAD(P)/FAD-dependent oxidoreductase n=1 Tax=Stenotrophomonas TaxID=40323 RepID=UPI00066AF98F|nr:MULTISPECIES: NAD(P)/FAD-dependent oxidoreductase [Stenotrophomonas]KOQ76979.1 amine oxidase [Stenotrophomonas maltophilia]MBS4801899.1 NAD(P)/FAD-dependent oxidoreductase [Stenotrophomonas maltophilia]MDG9988532.1 NAD(P)/FAD-dependent oxidoreductase [Stenotrophomonas sp. GD04024]MDH1231997.1 NAD(P)/FAD-dependent oxidoreductase [Stenotrophomonas sp. GD03930]MDH2062027.1 NAD(P)/FAD-dependent oxidoreductase [Stenotrophomonas maltophilia]